MSLKESVGQFSQGACGKSLDWEIGTLKKILDSLGLVHTDIQS